MTRPVSLFLLLLLCGTRLVAQNNVYGTVKSASGEVLDFATVVLLRLPDSTVAQMTATDSTGFYTLPLESANTALLKVVAQGYQTVTRPLEAPLKDSLNFVLSAAGRELKGVTVTARKPLIERKADRTVFNVDNSIASIGGDAVDALKRAPGVVVNNNNVSIAGKSTVTVMLNDRLVQLSGEELLALLKTIPASSVSRIEVITTPPARYDAAGNSGIINIVTKKNLNNGLNGLITTGWEQRAYARGFANGNFNYRYNKLNVYGNTNYYRGRFAPLLQSTARYPGQVWEQRQERIDDNLFNRNQLGIDYTINSKSVIGVLYTYGMGGPQYEGEEHIRAVIRNNHGGIDSMVNTDAVTRDRGWRNVANLNYEWKIDTSGRKLNVDFDYFTRTGIRERGFTTANYFADGVPSGIRSTNRVNGKQAIDIRSGKLDIEWPLKWAALSFGGKASFIHNTSSNIFEYLQQGVYLNDTGRTNEFDYKENTQALYVSARKELEKWAFQAGLRGEYTQTKGYSPTLQQENKNRYFQLFPTVFVQYKISEKQSVNINYSRRIERPGFWSMNPFRSYVTNVSYDEGNPFLQPAFSSNIELGYSLGSGLTLSLYGQQIDQYLVRVSSLDTSSQAIIFRQTNTGRMSNVGLSVSTTFKPFKWWESNIQLDAYYSRFTSSYYGGGEEFSFSKPTFYTNITNSFTLNRKATLLAELNGWYQAREQDDFDLLRDMGGLEVGFKALFLDKRLALSFYGQDLLRTGINRLENQHNGIHQKNYYDQQGVTVSLSWKFGNNFKSGARTRKTGADEESRAR